MYVRVGQRYDKEGILRQWWTNASIDAFKEKQECFREQYSQYEIFGFNVSGSVNRRNCSYCSCLLLHTIRHSSTLDQW